MVKFEEELTGGLVNNKNPHLLAPAELAGGAEGWYIQSDDLLYKAPALATAASASGTSGMSIVNFDSGTAFMVAAASGKYNYSAISAHGALSAFSVIASATGATALATALATGTTGMHSVAYNNKYVLMDGLNENLVLRSNMTSRKHGLKPVKTVLIVASASASANVFPANATGYFDYWYTEAVELTGDPEDILIESAYEATSTDIDLSGAATPVQNAGGPSARQVNMNVATIQVLSLATTVTLTLPALPENPTATHYYIYRSVNKEFETDSTFPVAFKVGRVPIGTLQFIDGLSGTSDYFYPQELDAVQALPQWTWANTGNGVSKNSTEFTDDLFADVTLAGTTSFNQNATNFIVKTFNVTPSVYPDPISAMQIEVRANRQGFVVGYSYSVAISVDGGVSFSSDVLLGSVANHPSVTLLQTPFTTFGRANFTTNDLSNSNFRIRIRILSFYPPAGQNVIYQIDGIRMRIKYNGNETVLTSPYPGIVIEQGEDTFVASAGGEPPIASTGTIFQGTLVTNDVVSPGQVRWSLPGVIDAFPTLYYFVLDGEDNDRITHITTLNGVCIIGTQTGLYRVNFLPTEESAGFNRNTIYEPISKTVGIVNNKAACTFTAPDGNDMLAFVSTHGIYVTNGDKTVRWDTDFKFTDITNGVFAESGSMFNPQNIRLVNDKATENLLLFYHYGGVQKVLPLSYSSRHLKQGPKFKIGLAWGISTASGNLIDATFGRLESGESLIYALHNDGTIKLLNDSNSGTYTASSNSMVVTTRYLIPSGWGEEYQAQRLHLFSNGAAISATTMTLTSDYTDKTGSPISLNRTFPTDSVTSKVDFSQLCERAYVTFTGPANSTLQKLGHFYMMYDNSFGDRE